MSKIYVIGIGPGAYDQMTGKAIRAMNESDAIIGYTVYVDLVKEYFPGKEFMTTPMKKEVDRCVLAFEEAKKGKTVSMRGDSAFYNTEFMDYMHHEDIQYYIRAKSYEKVQNMIIEQLEENEIDYL